MIVDYHIIIFRHLKWKKFNLWSLHTLKNWRLKHCTQRFKSYYKEFIDYFPDYDDLEHDYIPQRKLFWDIFSTFDYELAQSYVNFALEQRDQKAIKEHEKEVEVSEDIMIQLNKSGYFTKSKGRALHRFKYGKDIEKLKRKRKLEEYKTFDLKHHKQMVRKAKRPKIYDSPDPRQSTLKFPTVQENQDEEEEDDQQQMDISNA